MSVIKLQKEAEFSQNQKPKKKNLFGFIVLQTQLTFFPGSQNKQVILGSY